MTVESVLQFLVPYDWLQWIFLLAIAAVALVNVFFVNMTANEATWEINWKRGTTGDDKDDFDTEHGSVHDISDAVASPWERLADSMPGILLIIGLLGTFIGLGVALNEAAKVVSANEGIGALGATMEGLGTKFKTSTWGIIAYLLFKIWVARDGFESRRLQWCAGKMKVQLNQRRKTQFDRDMAVTRLVVDEVRVLGVAVTKAISDTSHENLRVFNNAVTVTTESRSLLAAILKSSTAQYGEIKKFVDASADNLDAIKNSANEMGIAAGLVGQSATQLSGVLDQLKTDLNRSISDMNSSVKGNLESVSAVMKEAGQGVAESARELNTSVAGFESNVTNVLSQLKSDLSSAIQGMSNKLAESVGKIEVAVGAVPKAVGTTMEKVEESLKTATGNLDTSIQGMSSQLTSAVNEIQTEIRKLPQSVSTTMDRLQTAFSGNLDKIDSSLTKATGKIVAAVDTVPQAMNEVQAAIKTSVEIQTRANGKFDATTKELRETVAGMQQFVQSLGGDIKAGLRSISDTGLRIASLEGRFTSLTSNAEENVSQLKELVSSIQSIEVSLQSFVGQITKTLQKVELERQHLIDSQKGLIGAVTSNDEMLRNLGNDVSAMLGTLNMSVEAMSSAMTGLKNALLMRDKTPQVLVAPESIASIASSLPPAE